MSSKNQKARSRKNAVMAAAMATVASVLITAIGGSVFQSWSPKIFAAENSSSSARENLAKQWLAVASDLADRDNETREFAESVLRRHPEWSLPTMREIAANGGSSIQRQISARLLGEIGERGDEKILLTLLTDSDYFVRMNAWKALPDFYERAPEPLLLERLRGEFPVSAAENLPVERMQAAVLFGIFKTEELSPDLEAAIIPLLKKSNLTLRRAAVTTLRFAGSSAAANAIIAELSAPDLSPEYFAEICAALRKMPATDAIPVLAKFLVRSAEWAIPATGVLAANGNDVARQKLRELAATENPRRFAALAELVEIETSPEIFWQALDDPSPRIRILALRALDKWLQSPEAKIRKTDALVETIATVAGGDNSPEVRALAAIVFAKIDRAAAVNGLRDAATDPAGQVDFRLAAISALGQLAASEAMRSVSDCAKDNNLTIAIAATRALSQIPDSAERLWEITGDPRQAVSATARQYLYALSGEDPGNQSASREAWRQKFILPNGAINRPAR